MAELSPKDPHSYSEFPYIKREEINKALEKLERLKLIFFDKDIHQYMETDEGLRLIDNMSELIVIQNEFDDNFTLNYIDKKVLFYIYKKGADMKSNGFIEFPSLNKKCIQKSLDKLNILKFVMLDKQKSKWIITEDGLDFMNRIKDNLSSIEEEYKKNSRNKT